MTLRAFLGVLLLAGICGAAEPETQPDFWIDGAAVNGDGNLVAFGRNLQAQLGIFADGKWRMFPVPLPKSSVSPRKIISLKDGRVAVVWSVSDGKWILTVLKGAKVEQSIPFDWENKSWDHLEMTEDSDGGIWLTGEVPKVVRARFPDSGVVTYDLTPFRRANRGSNWNDVGFLEDGRGTRWLWTRNTADNYAGIDLPVRVEGETLSPLSDVEAMKGQALMDVQARDRDSLWFVARKGVFVFSLDTLQAEKVPPPGEKDFRFLYTIIPNGKNWVLFGGSPAEPELWELRAGKWVRRVLPPHVAFNTSNPEEPYYMRLHGGLVFAARDGLLFLPDGSNNGKLLDWHNGWLLGSTRSVVPIKGSRFFATPWDSRAGCGMVANLEDYLLPKPAVDASMISPRSGWAVDANDRVFTILDDSLTVNAWTGREWIEIARPESLPLRWRYDIEIDARGRIWVFPDSSDLNRPIAILSPDLKTWETFPRFDDALVKYHEDLDGFAKAREWKRPILGPRGQMAYRTPNWLLRYWNGSEWRSWKLEEIIGPASDDRVSTPFFSPEGDLCVNTLKSPNTWRLVDGKQWKSEAKREGIPDRWTENQSHVERAELPDGFSAYKLRSPSVAVDNQGRTWVAGSGRLFVFHNGRIAPVFEDGKMHPFLASPSISEVRTDRAGNTWIKTGSLDRVMIPARKHEAPKAAVKVDALGLATLEAATGDQIEYSIDHGPWQTVKPGTRAIGYLFEGRHEIEVRFVTPELDVLGPVHLECQVSTPMAEQLGRFVDVLAAGPDSDRAEAVRALTRKPDEAVKVLKSREAKSETEKWWIEAAVQECEREAAKPH